AITRWPSPRRWKSRTDRSSGWRRSPRSSSPPRTATASTSSPPTRNEPMVRIASFEHRSSADRRQLKRFVAFHWTHYLGDPRYVPLLDYEYLGSRLLGITGFFEARNLFFDHGDARFFLALEEERIVGRCTAFVNDRHNAHAGDRTGFFGHFECVDDRETAHALLDAAEQWVQARGMTSIRGPQNFPVNEATPGFLIDGFDSRPVVYYHFNKPYYAPLVQ